MAQTAAYRLAPEAESLFQRHADWWQRKGKLKTWYPRSPLGDLWLPLSDGTLATHDLVVTPDMLDLDRLTEEPLPARPLGLHGELFETRAPYGRVPWVEAILGCPIRATIQGGSMRTDSFVKDWDEWQSQPKHRDDEWFGALKRLTELLVVRSQGRYAVVQTLMRGPSDLAEAVLGPELTCLSMYDNPVVLRRFLDEVTETFLDVLWAQLNRTPRLRGGYVSAFGIWAPGSVVRTQCDASAFLSPRQYAEWFMPYDERICQAVDYSIIHLHSGSLHTVDALLGLEALDVIQVSIDPEPASPPVKGLVPTLQRILAVKPLIVSGPMSEEDVALLEEELPEDGLCIQAQQGTW
ncbi:MAG: hypothetical protein FJZ90_12050 [Chloroflexi bacterium]|nr:hypothetical protein [Chloroflexota bacterium]